MFWSLVAITTLSAAAPETLNLATLRDEATLARTLWATSPDLQLVRGTLAAARADAQRAKLWPNPGLDLSLNTLPVGPTNPIGLQDPWVNVPNLQLGVSWLVELGKRGPRQTATQKALEATRAGALEQVRHFTLGVADVIADIAFAEVRIAQLTAQSADATHLVELQRARASKGDTSLLDADRAQLEQEGVLTMLEEAKQSLAEGLTACARLAGVPCRSFADPELATAWLQRTLSAPEEGPLRPDLRALEAMQASATALSTLASNRGLPDPTLRAGYVHDRFVASGNQQNSLFVGVSLPLPFMEPGRVDAQAYALQAAAAQHARERLTSAISSGLPALNKQLDSVQARLERLSKVSVPLARSVVERLEVAVTRGGALLQELLLARRTLSDLLLATNELGRTSYHLQLERVRLAGGFAPSEELLDEP